MKNIGFNFVLLLTISFLIIRCGTTEKEIVSNHDNENNSKGLKDYYQNVFFEIGCAIKPQYTENKESAELLKKHFSTLTAENVMKWSAIQPREGIFDFANADKIIEFAETNTMKIRGHTLVWHRQVPDWVFEDNGKEASKELVLQRMKKHITTVMNRYKGKIYAWDVINEVIDDGQEIYRKSKWYNICGEDFIFEAFRIARETDPEAKLFYNDYLAIDPIKSKKINDLIAKLKAQNLIDGLGIQGHWNIEYPNNELITNALNLYAENEIDIQITELDVSVYTSDKQEQISYTNDIIEKQKKAYTSFFEVFRKNKAIISNVTLWGLTDNKSWLNNWPVKGRNDYPLLFDKSYQPKDVFFSITKF